MKTNARLEVVHNCVAMADNDTIVLCSACQIPMTVRGEQLVMFVQGLIERDLVCEVCGAVAKYTARPQNSLP